MGDMQAAIWAAYPISVTNVLLTYGKC